MRVFQGALALVLLLGFANPPVAMAGKGKGADWSEVCEKLVRRAGQGLKSKEAKAVATAMTVSGFKGHARLQKVKPGTLVTSPFSILSMFGMLLNGAEEKSFDEIAAAFELPASIRQEIGANPSRDQIRAAFNQGYLDIGKNLKDIGSDTTLAWGNIAVIDQRFQFKEPYKRDLATYLGAAAESWDFSNGGAVVQKLNDYIATNTRDMIKDLLTPDDAPDVWALVNAGYFKAPWEVEFDVARTDEEGTFTKADGSTKTVPMMSFTSPKLQYLEHPNFQLASLPYKNADFAMDIFVPTQGKTPSDILPLLERYGDFIGQAELTELEELTLPRWEVRSELRDEMKAVFSQLMPNVFDNANFRRMLDQAPPLGQLVHAAVVKTNEKGSEGAFVTYGGGLESVAPMKPSLLADRPFIAVIRHVPTGIPLFVISEWDPKPLPKPGANGESETSGSDKTGDLSAIVSNDSQTLDGAARLLARWGAGERVFRLLLTSVYGQELGIKIFSAGEGPYESKVKSALQYMKQNSVPTYKLTSTIRDEGGEGAPETIQAIVDYFNEVDTPTGPSEDELLRRIAQTMLQSVRTVYTINVIFYQYYRIQWDSLPGSTPEQKIIAGFSRVKAEGLDNSRILLALRSNNGAALADDIESYMKR